MANLVARSLVLRLAVTVTGFAQNSVPWHDPGAEHGFLVAQVIVPDFLAR